MAKKKKANRNAASQVSRSKQRNVSAHKRRKRPSMNLSAHRSADYRRQEDEMLAEFSDASNNFYVDEMAQRRTKAKSKKRNYKIAKRTERKAPMSPTKRKLITIISYAAIVSVVLIVGVVLSLTVLFKTQVYEVTGSTKYSEDEIVNACGISKGENIFLSSKSAAEKKVKDAFAYIEDVDVGFKIPDTIKISITEAVEGYLVKNSDSEYLVISTKGRILDKVSDSSSYSLPIFIGPKLISGEIGSYVSYEDEKVVAMIDAITTTFADNGYQGITEIDATDAASISFTYDDRIKVVLGIPEDLDYKIRTAMTIINENLDVSASSTVTGVLDVSRSNSTKRSYFDEEAIHPTEAATENPSEADTKGSSDTSNTSPTIPPDAPEGYGEAYAYDDGGYYDVYGNYFAY